MSVGNGLRGQASVELALTVPVRKVIPAANEPNEGIVLGAWIVQRGPRRLGVDACN